jgi:Kelch motif
MGCGASNSKEMVKPARGFFPSKIVSADKKGGKAIQGNNYVKVPAEIFLFGGSKVLKFDTKGKKISPAAIDAAIKIPKRTQSLLFKNEKHIALVGGILDDKTTNQCLLLELPSLKCTPLPNFPTPIKYTTLVEYQGLLVAIGGETDGQDPDCISKKIYTLKIEGGIGTAWEHHSDLPIGRRSANVVVTPNNFIVFGGYSGKGLRSTQIDIVEVSAKSAKQAPYRIPLGVEGARLAWHGDYILLIGGKRTGDNPDNNVLLLDFERKAILSTRDLNQGRDFPVTVPVAEDEVVVIGGGKLKNAEHRSWCEQTHDYVFKPITIEGAELLEDPSHYNAALPTFLDDIPDAAKIPTIDLKNNIIFGNEIDCFLIEFPQDLVPYFYFSPLKLQQKTGQSSLRFDARTVYMCAGTDTTRTKISVKTYKFYLDTKEIIELAKMNVARYFPAFINHGSDFYAIGGKTTGGKASKAIEKLSVATETQSWTNLADLPAPRFGHVAWVADKKIYVLGGTSADAGKPTNEVIVYDIPSNAWSKAGKLLFETRFCC